jgi:hypothetical protein
MKSILFVISVSILTLAPLGALAGSELGVAVGYSVPTGSMTDEAKGGPQFGANFGLQAGPQVMIGAEVFYNMYGLSDEMQDLVDETLGSSGDLDLTVTQYTLYSRVNLLPAASTLYAKFCAGMYRSAATASQGDIDITTDSTDFGLGAGLGYQFFGLGNTGGFGEVMYHSIMGDGETAIYLDFRAGVAFRFL